MSATVKFTSYDGLELEGTFVPTASNETRAAALLVHGITADREEWGFYTRLAERLAKWGVSSMRFDYRCHGAAKSVPMQELSIGGIVNDIGAAHAALLEQPQAQAAPLMVVAVSFGSGAAARWCAVNGADVALVVLCSPVLDYEADLESVADDWRAELARSGTVDYVGHQIGRPLVNETALLRDVDLVREVPSTVIFHGTADADVPIDRSRRVVAEVAHAHLEEIDGADHGFVQPGDTEADSPQTFANYETVFERLKRHVDEMGSRAS